MPNSYGSWRTGVQIDNIYPVGSLYFSINATNPGQLFGGTWEQIKDKFFLSAGDTYTAGAIGGNATHTHSQVSTTSGGPSTNTSGGPSTTNTGSTTLSVSQMPSHSHNLKGGHGFYHYQAGSTDARPTYGTGNTYTWGVFYGTDPTGGGGGHTHTLNSHTHTLSSHTHTTTATTTGSSSSLPPYLVIYVFKRTA